MNSKSVKIFLFSQILGKTKRKREREKEANNNNTDKSYVLKLQNDVVIKHVSLNVD